MAARKNTESLAIKKNKYTTEEKKITDAEAFAQKIINESNFEEHLKGKFLEDMREELIEKYKSCSNHLDSKFLKNTLYGEKSQIIEGLWELIIVDYLTKSPTVNIIENHSNAGPDWKVRLNNNEEFYIEATCAGLPQETHCSEIHRVVREIKETRKNSSDNLLIQEAKSRISNAIDYKLKKHAPFMKDKKCGYLLVVSYGHLPFYATCDLYNAIKTVYPFGDLTLTFSRTGNPSKHKVVEQSLAYQNEFPKISSPTSKINTNILGNPEYNWVSGILFSKTEVYTLLEEAKNLPNINWKGEKNDFVLVHNPSAQYSLSEDLFNSATRIIIRDNQLVVEGKDIFSTI